MYDLMTNVSRKFSFNRCSITNKNTILQLKYITFLVTKHSFR